VFNLESPWLSSSKNQTTGGTFKVPPVLFAGQILDA
jgi:hypothetical protein